MNTIAVWYLIVNAYHGGTIAVPQASKEQCISNAAFVQNHGDLYDPSVFCIPGILTSNESPTRN